MIAVIDYGVGNLRSVEKALHFLGYEARVSGDKDFISKADGVILPGVGAFADAMERLKKDGMDKMVHQLVETGKPFLGICLGMQLLFDYSEEGGRVRGLGVLPGRIKRLPENLALKVPHMGWNKLKAAGDNPLLRNLENNAYVYFVHSYYLEAENKEDVIATTHYGIEFDVAVSRDNIFATQFHPEKSGRTGLKILKNFAEQVISP